MTDLRAAALRAAVIGLGAMGANHARLYAEIPGTQLCAVADTDTAKAAAAAHGAAVHSYYSRMLDEARPDLVSVCVPTRAHFEVAASVIQRGIPLLVEKPLAATIEEGERLRDLAAARGVSLTVGHIERFNPAVLELKRRLRAGELGRVYQVHARRLGPFPHRVRDVGVVLDLAPHDIDVMRFLLDSEVVRVQAETEQRIATEHEDMLAGVLRFANGVVGVLDVNWLTPTKIRELTVLGERGMFVVDYLARELTFFENPRAAPSGDPAWAAHHGKGVTEGSRTEIPVEKREPLRAELESFAHAVRTGAPVSVTAEDGLAAMRAAQALIEAANTGEPVHVPAGAAS
ncbi:MAG TPA: Gfo/Idh/MocA family oxidoreductase [Dehalococcoidia bacterium]|nr:Gfo/Idh/MocA family oxidoreductase [Dehalococcoidia bacterium]